MLGRRESSLARKSAETGISRFDPWVELEQMRSRMDELFSKVFGYTPLSKLISPPAFEPAVDLCESPDSVLVTAYVPGLTKDDIDLNVTPDSITISGEWKRPHVDDKNIVCHISGIASGRFQVTYDLPAEIDPNGCKAVYKDGVLQITLPKTETEKRKAVKVRVEES
ncbi:MAG: Hsp20/alpha crystallin family protein [Armatimonadota bacterium]|nr:Hsp20/alpha crystallin family protein [Armatimonadota bacterium]